MSKAKYVSTNEIKLQSQKAMAELSGLDEFFRGGLDPFLKKAVVQAATVAKIALRTTDHTQSMGDLLVDEIGCSAGGGQGAVIAPIHYEDMKLRNQMYYAEYGAGVLGGKQWKYPSSIYDKSPERDVDPKGRVQGSRKGSYKYKTSYKFGGWVGVTDYSKPAGYMQAARQYLVINARPIIAEGITFNIAKPYHRAKAKNVKHKEYYERRNKV